MSDDDLIPPKKGIEPVNLEVMSIAALTEYAAALQREIARVQAAIGEKERARQGAEAIFRS